MRKTTTLAVASLAALLVLTGCASATPAPSEDKATEVTPITVGIIPVAEFSNAYVAQDEGFFEEEGLDVTIEVVANAAAIVPSVLNGQYTFGAAATPPFFTAVEKGIPIVAVANAANTTDEATGDTGALVVKKGSDITTLKGLEGKTIAVNALSSLPHVAGVARLAEEGVDVASINFVAMPFPDMQGALEQGRVDAVLTVEPFMTQTLAAAGTELSPLYVDVYPAGTTHTLYFASAQYAGVNPEVVDKFRKAIAKANDLISKDDKVLRDALVKYGNMPENVAESVTLPVYLNAFEIEGMQVMADKMKETGFLTTDIDVTKSILK